MEESRVETVTLASDLLQGNPLGDPAERPLSVYVPPGYDPDRSQGYPTLLGVVGYTGTGRGLLNVDPFGETIQERMDRLIAAEKAEPALVVLPDCFTRFGGNQYLDSSATGPYMSYLVEEVVPFVSERWNTGRWGVWGKSSGGYGAMVLAMRNPHVFHALADHSGDAGFEYAYLPDFPHALDAFRRAGGPTAWFEAFWEGEQRGRYEDLRVLMILLMAASYSPNPDSPHLGVDLPFDLDTGALREDVWRRWLAHDPVRMVPHHAAALRSLDMVFVDCGLRDEGHLLWGARQLHRALQENEVDHLYEEFDDGHRGLSYRYDRSLPLLTRALAWNGGGDAR